MKQKKNYLDCVPKHNPLHSYTLNPQKHIEIKIHNRGFCCKIAQLCFHRPKYSVIELDEFGSFIWECINGTYTIYDISLQVREHFGEKAEPLYERLCCFLKTLQRNGLILLLP